MKPVDYLHLQMALEGIAVGDGKRITRMHPNVEDFPLVVLAQTRDKEKVVYFDDAMPPALYHKLSTGDLKSFKIEMAIEAFGIYGIRTEAKCFKTYTFPENFTVANAEEVRCFRKDDPKVIAFGFDGLAAEVYAIERDGRILSACVSSRENLSAAESWVYTRPDQRRKGLAQQVIRAWAASVHRAGKIPFYSHAIENIGSTAVASKMRLVHLFDVTVLEAVDVSSSRP